MNIEKKEFLKFLKNITKSIENLIKYDNDFERRIKKIDNELKNLKKIDRSFSDEIKNNIQEIINYYEEKINKTKKEIERKFGNDLKNKLDEIHLSLKGNYPLLKAGLFTIEINFDKFESLVWYGPKEERLFRVELNPENIVNKIKKIKQQLDSRFSEEFIFEKIKRVYYENYSENSYAPIIEFLNKLALCIQDKKFQSNPVKENYKSYGRVEFSYDLFRIKQKMNLFSNKIELKIATRENTKSQLTYLWVPSSIDGNGSTYSHIKIK